MNCRPGCAACCTVISISSPLPNMPRGKPAGRACVHLVPETLLCRIWNHPEYPRVCRNFLPDPAYCGRNRGEALAALAELEALTHPVKNDTA